MPRTRSSWPSGGRFGPQFVCASCSVEAAGLVDHPFRDGDLADVVQRSRPRDLREFVCFQAGQRCQADRQFHNAVGVAARVVVLGLDGLHETGHGVDVVLLDGLAVFESADADGYCAARVGIPVLALESQRSTGLAARNQPDVAAYRWRNTAVGRKVSGGMLRNGDLARRSGIEGRHPDDRWSAPQGSELLKVGGFLCRTSASHRG